MRTLFSKSFLCLLLLLNGWQMTASALVIEHVEGVDLNLKTNELAYTFFSLPSGESTLIQAGNGLNILIDTGDESSQQALSNRLSVYHVQVIDTVIITNPNQEYTGNLNWILKNFNVNKIIVPSLIKDELITRHQLPLEKVISWNEGKQKEIAPGLLPNVLHMEETESKGALVFTLSFEDHRTLFSGVANVEVETQLASEYSLKSAVLKVADFGSENGTSQLFLDEVDPQVAILFKKRAMNVSELVLERLQETWIDIYQTGRHGNVTIKYTGNDYEIVTLRSDEDV